MDIERLIEDAKAICAIPAPTFAESERAQYVRERLGPAAALDDAGNVICAFGVPDGDALVFAAHLDTVFARDVDLEIRHESGRIHAPGIGDNSLAVAALLALAEQLRADPPPTRVVLAATVGEEGLGDLRGAKHVIATVPCRAFVAVEGSMLPSIKHAGVGSTRYRVTYRGAGGHSWTDRGAPSAVHGLVTAAARFLATPAPAGVSRNIGRITGGTSINTIAAQASLELDLRAESAEPLAAEAERARDELGAPGPGLTADVELIGQRPSGGIAADHPLMQAARDARARAGLAPAQLGASSTDANAAYGAGVPAITVGLTTGANAHRLDEYIDLEPLPDGARALELLLRNLAHSP